MTTPPESTAKNDNGDAAGTTEEKRERRAADRERWPGGYIRGGIFVIEKRIRSVKFHVSTHCTSLRGALKQLERFEADPRGYRPDGPDRGEPLVMTQKLIDRFYAWHEPTVTHTWARNVRSLLIDWSNHFKGDDLRALNLIRDIKPHLAEKKQRHHRAKAIKVFFGWLRAEEGLITREQDVTLDLAIPILPPAQNTKPKAVPWKAVVAVAAHLPAHVRDVLDFLAVTGWHVAEVRRFAVGGTIRARNPIDEPEVIAVIGTVHKSGGKHFTAIVHQELLDVAERIRKRGRIIDNGRLRKHMLRAAETAGVEPFQLGSLRHSVATWLTQAGIGLADSARYLGHDSPTTTKRHYVNGEVAAIVLPSRALRIVG